MKKVKASVIIVIVALLLLAAPVVVIGSGVFVAQSDIPTFDNWLRLVSGPLLGTAVAVLLSWVVEFWRPYQELSKRWKRLSYLGACIVIGVGSSLLRAALGYVPLTFDPLVWHAFWNAFAQFGIGTAAHEILPKAK